MENNLTYEGAMEELKEIALQIDNESVTVDVLADKVKRASELIEFCQLKLKTTETEINQIIKKMESQ
jgi:exodeoxyribonuclease VII small subunit